MVVHRVNHYPTPHITQHTNSCLFHLGIETDNEISILENRIYPRKNKGVFLLHHILLSNSTPRSDERRANFRFYALPPDWLPVVRNQLYHLISCLIYYLKMGGSLFLSLLPSHLAPRIRYTTCIVMQKYPYNMGLSSCLTTVQITREERTRIW